MAVNETTTFVKLYPDQTKNLLVVELTDGESAGTICITDVTGKTALKQTNANEEQIELNISSLENGIYFLRFQSHSAIANIKFIKE